MDEEIIQRLESLEQFVLGLQDVAVRSLASGIVLSSRREVLQKVTTEALEQLGIEPSNHPTLLAQLRALEREACENQLRRAADNNPALATALKEIVDRIFSRQPPPSEPSAD